MNKKATSTINSMWLLPFPALSATTQRQLLQINTVYRNDSKSNVVSGRIRKLFCYSISYFEKEGGQPLARQLLTCYVVLFPILFHFVLLIRTRVSVIRSSKTFYTLLTQLSAELLGQTSQYTIMHSRYFFVCQRVLRMAIYECDCYTLLICTKTLAFEYVEYMYRL